MLCQLRKYANIPRKVVKLIMIVVMDIAVEEFQRIPIQRRCAESTKTKGKKKWRQRMEVVEVDLLLDVSVEEEI